VALVVNKHRLFVANVGDSRSVLARDEGSGLVPIRMSRDHNLKDPKEYERCALNYYLVLSAASQGTG
jgi:serine/threonine protein phosphatase PrpC